MVDQRLVASRLTCSGVVLVFENPRCLRLPFFGVGFMTSTKEGPFSQASVHTTDAKRDIKEGIKLQGLPCERVAAHFARRF